MDNTAQPPEDDDIQTQRDIDEVFSRANPNPDRVGCPPRDELIALAARRLPIGSPGYEHLSKCSPCYREFRALQEQLKQAAAAPAARSRRWALAAVAAAVVLVATAGAWWLTNSERRPDEAKVESLPTTALARAEVDLRPFTVTRSDQPSEPATAIQLPATLVDITILFPVGAEPGDYDVRLLDSAKQSRGDATGKAAIENYLTTMRVRLDLRQLPEGPYQLAVRRQGDSWREYPLAIR
jgi:hypothetical protein